MDERVLRTLEFDKIRERLVEKAATRMGKELCASLMPSTKMLEVRHRLRETSEARALLRSGSSIPLGGIHDLRPVVRRAALGGILEPAELLDVADTAAACRRLKKFLLDHRDEAPTLAAYGNQIGVFANLEAEIRQAITDEGEVADDASPALSQIRKQMRVLQARVRERLEAMIRNPNMRTYLQDAIITIRDDRYVLPVKVEYRSQVPGIVHDQSASGSTLYIEPMAVVELNNELKRLALEEREEIRRILTRLSDLVAAEAEAWDATLEAVGRIDLCAAKGLLSQEMDAVAPELNDRGVVVIRQGRHPLLPGRPVPIDLHLGKTFDVLVITGPNTGGKTVTLKTVGLFALMAQAGLHVPAAYGTELAVFPQVFADIGDEQSIEQSLSTFSSHMSRIVEILNQLEPGALVLLDEIGAGTDPTEGAALAMAILDHLQARGARVVATTHYSELKAFAYSRPRVENASVEFDLETLRPTYKLAIGVPGASQAFEISLRLGLSPVLVERARGFLTRDEEKVERLLAQIQASRAEAEREREAAYRARAEAERLRAEAEARLEEARRREKEVVERARAEAARILQEVRREAETLIEDLKAARRQQLALEQERAIEAARSRVRGLEQRVAALQPAEAPPAGPPPEDLRPGEEVRVRSLDVRATVLTPPDADGNLQVQAGILKVTVHITDVERLEPAKAGTGARRGAQGLPAGAAGPAGYRPGGVPLAAGKAAGFRPELDLRGVTVEEALAKVDKHLDDAVLAGAPQVRIIHGRGTGALRQAIQKFLKEHPAVVSFRLGSVGEGGDGVTIVRLQE
ncbi:MAG: endonuclease MutS2 [Firmicutes bacterium]|nr:endonuclease MutS2 [Bacillota bacterium]